MNKSIMMLSLALFATNALSETNNLLEIQNKKLVEIHGSATQAWVKTDKNKFFGNSNRSGGSFDWTEVSLNARVRPVDRVSFAGQILARNAGEMEDNIVDLDYLFADIDLAMVGSAQVSMQLGRMRHHHGFFNEFRDIAITTPSILLPQSVYWDRSRTLLTRADGVMLRATHVGKTSQEFGFGYFPNQLHTEADTKVLFLGSSSFPGEMESDQSITAYWTSHWAANWKTHFSYSRGRFNYRSLGLPSDVLGNGKSRVGAGTASIEFDSNTGHRITVEGMYGLFESSGYEMLIPIPWRLVDEYAVRGVYAQYTRYFDRLDAFIRYDDYSLRDSDIKSLTSGPFAIPEETLMARDWTIGARYFLKSNMSISAEYHYVEGTGWLSRIENPDRFSQDKFWNLLAVQFTVTF